MVGPAHQEPIMFSLSRPFLAAIIAIGAIGAGAAPADAAFFSPRPFMQPLRSPLLSGPFSTSGGVAAWARLHTEAPSQFHAPLGGSSKQLFARRPFGANGYVGNGFFNGPAAGPAGAQFGRLPTSNQSFINPQQNSTQARQTQNSVQAQNTQMSG